jgi:hypothetical protein
VTLSRLVDLDRVSGVLATTVVGGFVGRDRMLARACHGCAGAVWVSVFEFDGYSRPP